jgi:enoyl-CoA hydratase/carnithine racemase
LIHIDREGAIATVTLNRPNKLNSLTPAMLDQLERTARELDADPELRVVILRRWVRRGHQVFDQWARLRQPVITAVNGHAFGGGLELAITGDIRIAADHAQFALPEASIGTCPGWSGTQRLVKLVGASRAKYLALSGVRLSAADALAGGLVHEVVASTQLRDRAMALAREMSLKAPVSLQLTKQLVNAAAGEDAAATLEAMAGALAATTVDASEGIRSFREKRAPNYLGH